MMVTRVWVLCGLIGLQLSCTERNLFRFEADLPGGTHRCWIGPEFWANRLQDWQLSDGRIECSDGRLPMRTVHLLTRELSTRTGDIKMTVRTGLMGNQQLDRQSWNGFLLGAGGIDLDYRARSLVHLGSGPGGGLIAAIDGEGHICFYDNESDLQFLRPASLDGRTFPRSGSEDLRLELFARPDQGAYSITLAVYDNRTGERLQEGTISGVSSDRLTGNVALIANGAASESGESFWFRDWTAEGSKFEVVNSRAVGPIFASLFTLSKGVLNLTAQLPPVGFEDSRRVRLEVEPEAGTGWKPAGEAELMVPGWTASFHVENWDDSKPHRFRLIYPLRGRDGEARDHYFEGRVPADPRPTGQLVVAAFTGNSNTHGSFGKEFSFARNRIWFPHSDLVAHVASEKPDLLVFTGDQVYESRPTPPDRRGGTDSELDYLYKWLMWCWAYQDLTRSAPSVCLPDDHDVYHGNVWGAGGRAARPNPPDGKYPEYYKGFEGNWRQDGGGYVMSPEFVNLVQRTQTSHLPAPVDPAPVEQGIGVYFTSMTYGGISFAILEDRKFKSAPAVLLPDAKVVNGFAQAEGYDLLNSDVPGAELLGQRQERFLAKWILDWKGTWAKVALSQTILAAISTYPSEFKTDEGAGELQVYPQGVVPPGYELSGDMDSNGWPRSGRDRALRELRRGFTFMIGGDQHLASIVHHGVDDWDDAGFSFCVPSVANLWPRRWYPPHPGADREPGMPEYTGRFKDGFGNRVTVWAVSNPVESGHEPRVLHDRSPGYGLIRFDRSSRTITMECWPRYAQPGDPDTVQYPGWPKTISIEDNYAREPVAYLPVVQVEGIDEPVIQVYDDVGGELVYVLRSGTPTFRPWVFHPGSYTVRVGDPDVGKLKVINGLKAPSGPEEVLTVTF